MAYTIHKVAKRAAAAVAVYGLTLAAAHADNFNITIAAGHPPVTKGVSLLHDYFIAEINKRLAEKGEHTITWNEAYAGSLAGVREVLEAVEGGIADFGYVPTIFEADKLPLEQVTYITPFGTNDIAKLMGVIDKLHESVPEMNQAWADYNQKLLATVGVDSYHLLTTFEWTDVSELNGHKIAAGGLSTNWLRETGAAAISGSLPEYYNAIKTGLADGVIIFESGIAPYKFYEVAPYITKLNYGAQASSALSVNLQTWERFPKDVQDIIVTVADEYEAKVSEAYQALADASLKKAVEGGATVIDFPPEARAAYAKKLPNIAREWAVELDGKGLPGSALLETYINASNDAGVEFARDWLAE